MTRKWNLAKFMELPSGTISRGQPALSNICNGVYEHTKAAISPAYLVFTVHHHFSQSTLLSSIPSCLPRIATNSSVILGGPQT